MKLFDLETPQTKKSQKVLESYFGNSVDFTKLAPRAASNMLTKVRGLIYEHRTTTKMHNSEKDAGYLKLLVMERGLAGRLREADIKLEPQTGATKITTSDGETIGSTNDQATAMQLQKDVKDGKITLGEEGQTKHEFIRALFKSYFGQPDYNELTGGRSGMRRLKKITGTTRSGYSQPQQDTSDFEKQLKAAGLDQVRVKADPQGKAVTVLYPDDFRMQSITEADYSAKKARAGKDIGKPGKNFAKIAKSAGKKYGSQEAGKRVAGSILAKMREGMTLRTKSGRYLTESEVQQAQVILAAQDMVDRMQGMLEDITSMQFKDLPALSNSIQTTIGTTEAQAFNNAAGQSLGVLVDAIQAAKVEMEAAQGTLTGVEPVVPGQEEVVGVPMAGEPGADPLAAPVADVAVDAAAGGEAVDVDVDVEEPPQAGLGRARR